MDKIERRSTRKQTNENSISNLENANKKTSSLSSPPSALPPPQPPQPPPPTISRSRLSTRPTRTTKTNSSTSTSTSASTSNNASSSGNNIKLEPETSTNLVDTHSNHSNSIQIDKTSIRRVSTRRSILVKNLQNLAKLDESIKEDEPTNDESSNKQSINKRNSKSTTNNQTNQNNNPITKTNNDEINLSSKSLVDLSKISLLNSSKTNELDNEKSNLNDSNPTKLIKRRRNSSILLSDEKFKLNEIESSSSSPSTSTSTQNLQINKNKKPKLKTEPIQEETNESPPKETTNCPVKGCNSLGNLSGYASKHSSYDMCPLYYKMSIEECLLKAFDNEKNVFEIARKMEEEKKNLNLNKGLSSEQMKYIDKINNELNDVVHFKEEKKSSTEKLSLFNPDLVGDLRNLTTSFLFDSITTGVTPLAHNLYKLPNNNNDQLNKEISSPKINDLKISKFEFNLFKESIVTASQNQEILLDNNELINSKKKLSLINKNNKIIHFGDYEIETWYKSPYPDDFLELDKIYLCQYCLKYMKSDWTLNRHLEKCIWRHPPGKEIYRKDEHSFFEVDGKFNKIYCQNLCLLAKLFLDHKTLYYDVEPFLFYVLTKYNFTNGSFEMIGYFSKEKQSANNYNLSCILTLPPFMNKGYGRLLIDFSYLLSRVEGKIGSPERPLSDLGLISYRNYWTSTLLSRLAETIENSEISIKDLSNETGILTNDIISTFQFIGLIKYWKGKHVIVKNKKLINQFAQKKKSSTLELVPSLLKWKPYVVNNLIINQLDDLK